MMKQVQQDGLTYLINEKEENAEIIGYHEDRNNFLIPRSIKYESHEYIIQSISKNAFRNSGNIKSIEFSLNSELQTIEERAFEKSSIESIFIPPHVTKICKDTFSNCKQLQRIDIPSNSELQTIEKDAFYSTSIESIFIPASLIELKEGWCYGANKLITVKVDPRNSRYKNYEDEMIICKTTETNENYDEIVFCRRDIKEITIPSFIKIIGSYSFYFCQQLQRIDIPSNSELQIIEEKAFSESSIESIFIPPHVTKICEYAFSFCKQLQRIDIPSNSELQTIEKYAFVGSSIQSIFIPASLIDLKEGWCSYTLGLTTVKVDPRNSRYKNYEDEMIICKATETSENYDEIVFCRRDIKEITIPSFIKIIGSYSFHFCQQLQRFDIPSFIKIIGSHAFHICQQLQRIDIPSNSELQTIEEGAFSFSPIESIFIPASLIDLKEGWCASSNKLTKVKVDPRNSRYSYLDNKMIICKTTETNENYDEILFCRRDIKEITIPSFIKIIGSYSFHFCQQLQRINIPSNSELQTIEERAFLGSSIMSIFIPPHVTRICEDAFYNCKQLQRIIIPSNSELQIIEKKAFLGSSIQSIFIPHHVTKISEDAFSNCKKLNLIEIDEKSEIELYDISSIFPRGTIIMIPVK